MDKASASGAGDAGSTLAGDTIRLYDLMGRSFHGFV